MNDASVWKKIQSVLIGVVYVIFGGLMINNPVSTLKTLSLLMGWTVTILGIFALINAFRFKNDPEASSLSVIDGLLLLFLGVMFLFGNFINSTLILSYLLVFWVIIDSALQLNLIIHFPSGWVRNVTIIMDIAIIFYGFYMLFNPSTAEGFLVFMLGFSFIGTGVTKVIKVM